MSHILSCLCGWTKTAASREKGKRPKKSEKSGITKAFRWLCHDTEWFKCLLSRERKNSTKSCAYKQQRTGVNLISVEICPINRQRHKLPISVQNHYTPLPAEFYQCYHRAHREHDLFLSMVPIWSEITLLFLYYTLTSRPLLSPQALLLCLECVLIAVFLFLAEPLIFLLPLWTAVCQCAGMFLQRPHCNNTLTLSPPPPFIILHFDRHCARLFNKQVAIKFKRSVVVHSERSTEERWGQITFLTTKTAPWKKINKKID